MSKTEIVELTVLCLIQDGEKILLQNRVKKDWKGYTLPGGHVEAGESFVDAVKREMKEEAGLNIQNPKLVGIKQFPFKNEEGVDCRYIVLLFKAEEFKGEVVSSSEGEMTWVRYDQLSSMDTVDDLEDLLDVFNNPDLTEFQYLVDGDVWTVSKK
ncbi:8-oxo-dGTP diphosphatase [Butyrivibrio fibrisolvens]|uniref:DNA mismatch repair protein MutT n=1 Tax=Butyrivibrio fibrisolvens TaxID=831 RepID=A0A317G3W0_BUTFI|nr:8-oxo-dGTP diphosphatase [Butyrivibrio fibrisolvens]PWT27821.1 DNA mismatch repair protein MutT [Butyrivibrio fibrisolvens]